MMIQESIKHFGEDDAISNPFPGLRPFELHESHLFFGRDGLSKRLIEKLGRTRFLAVVGTSGSGKSSLVRAGLLPALLGGMMAGASSRWRVAIMRPGNDPVGNLARALCSEDAFGFGVPEENRDLQVTLTEAALRRGSLGLTEASQQAKLKPDENLLVIADQFEELFRVESGVTRAASGDRAANDKTAFVKLLLEASAQREVAIYVVLTMRSDYLGDCAQFQDLPEAINEGQYLIPRLTREQLRAAISGPIAVGGAQITPQLVNRLLNDIGDNQDQLPILQHALMRTWDKWREEQESRKQGEEVGGGGHRGPESDENSQPVDLRHYEAIGAMASALSRHADEAYEEVGRMMGRRGQQIVERLFKALTEKDRENRGVRRPVTFSNLCAATKTDDEEVTQADKDDLNRIIDCFRAEERSFLMPPLGKKPADTPLSDDSVIDISHESLIRNWKGSENEKRLREWIDEESLSARTYQRLYETALLYQNRKEELLRGVSLQSMLEWKARQQPTTAWARRYHPKGERHRAEQEGAAPDDDADADKKLLGLAIAFLEESQRNENTIAEKERRAALEKLEAEAQRKWAARLRWLSAALLVALLFSLVVAGYAFSQKVEADNLRKVAESQTQKADLQRKEADNQKQIALGEKDRAESEKAEAEKQRRAAEDARKDAISQRESAEGSRREAEVSARIAREKEAIAEAEKQQAKVDKQAAVEAGELAERNRVIAEKNRMIAEEKSARVELDAYSVKMSLASNFLLTNKTSAIQKLALYLPPDLVTYLPHDLAAKLPSDAGRGYGLRDFYWYYLWNKTHREIGDAEVLPPYSDNKQSTLVSPDGNLIVVETLDALRVWDVASGRVISDLTGNTIAQERGVKNALSPDSQILVVTNRSEGDASYQATGVLKLFDARSGRQLSSIETPFRFMYSWQFSPDSQLLAVSGSNTGGLFTVPLWGVWDVKTGNALYLLEKGESFNDFSPDSKMIAAADTKQKLMLKDARSGKPLRSIDTQFSQDSYVQFSKDGALLLVQNGGWTADSTGGLYDVRTARTIYTFQKKGEVEESFMDFSPDGRVLIKSASVKKGRPDADAQFHLLDVTTKRRVRLPNLSSFLTYDQRLTFSDDGKILLYRNVIRNVASGGNKIPNYSTSRYLTNLTALNTHTGDEVYKIDSPTAAFELPQYRDKLLIMHAEPKPRDAAEKESLDLVPLADVKVQVELTDIHNGNPLCKLDGDFSARDRFYFSEGGSKVIRVGGEGATNEVTVWDTRTGNQLRSFRIPPTRIWSLAFSSDGQKLVGGQDYGTLMVRDLSGQENFATDKWTAEKHTQDVFSVAISSDGKTLASGGYDHVVRLWNAETLGLLKTLEGHKGAVRSVAFAPPDAKILATGSEDKTIKLWDVQTGLVVDTFQGHQAGVTSLAFSPDGKRLVTGDQGGVLRLWDVATGRVLKMEDAHKGSVLSLAFSADGKNIASASEGKTTEKPIKDATGGNSMVKEDMTVKLWDESLTKLLATLEGHQDSVMSVSFSPDGKTLASGSKDGTLRLWDLRTYHELTKLVDAPSDLYLPSYLKSLAPDSIPAVLSVSFSPDGKKLAYSREGHKIDILFAATEEEVKQDLIKSREETPLQLSRAARKIKEKPPLTAIGRE